MRSPKMIAGLALLVFFVLLAILGPVLLHTDPLQTSDASLSPPSAQHWLGTTQSGQDVLAQVVYGARVSLGVGFLSALIATVLSIIVGLIGGYAGGLLDEILSLVTNVF